MILSISSFEIINLVISDRKTFFLIGASVADAAAVLLKANQVLAMTQGVYLKILLTVPS